jgi:hypothetical protein
MTETFEDYIRVRENSLNDTRNMLSLSNKEILYRLLIIKGKYDKKQQYTMFRSVSVGLNILRPDDQILILLKGMHELDTCCGIKEILKPEQTDEETHRILALLDNDLIKFKGIYKKWSVELKDEYYDVYTYFARLLFTFNGYQGPLRTSADKAIQDSLGLTDLFSELILEK